MIDVTCSPPDGAEGNPIADEKTRGTDVDASGKRKYLLAARKVLRKPLRVNDYLRAGERVWRLFYRGKRTMIRSNAAWMVTTLALGATSSAGLARLNQPGFPTNLRAS